MCMRSANNQDMEERFVCLDISSCPAIVAFSNYAGALWEGPLDGKEKKTKKGKGGWRGIVRTLPKAWKRQQWEMQKNQTGFTAEKTLSPINLWVFEKQDKIQEYDIAPKMIILASFTRPQVDPNHGQNTLRHSSKYILLFSIQLITNVHYLYIFI